MSTITDLNDYGQHVVTFEHLHKVNRLKEAPRTWRYIDDNSDCFNLSVLPTDHTLKSIFNAADNGLLTRDGMTRTITYLYKENKEACDELETFFAEYDLYAYARSVDSNINNRFLQTHGFLACDCISFLAWNWQYLWVRIEEDRPLDSDRVVHANKIISDLKNNFDGSGTILKYCDEKTRTGKVKFPAYVRRIFERGSILKEYKNGSFEVQYNEPMHRLYLTAMRFNERVEKIRTTLEVQDKLGGFM